MCVKTSPTLSLNNPLLRQGWACYSYSVSGTTLKRDVWQGRPCPLNITKEQKPRDTSNKFYPFQWWVFTFLHSKPHQSFGSLCCICSLVQAPQQFKLTMHLSKTSSKFWMNQLQKGEQNLHYSTCLFKVNSDYLLIQITQSILGISIKTTLRTAFQNILWVPVAEIWVNNKASPNIPIRFRCYHFFCHWKAPI